MSEGREARPPDRRPRRRLTLTYSRRGLLESLLKNVEAGRQRMRGGAAYKLVDLGLMTDEALAGLVPAVVQGCEVWVRDETVWVRPEGSDRLALFDVTSPELQAFNRFNGRDTMGQATALLARDLSWTRERSFALVRDLFLRLVVLGVCRPA